MSLHVQIDLRLSPIDKPRPAKFPKKDPMAVFLPLFNLYAERAAAGSEDDPRLHPVLSSLKSLPRNVLIVIAGLDVVVHESLTFAQRIEAELEEAVKNGTEERGWRSFETAFYEKAYHGWLEGLWPFQHALEI